MDAQVDWSGFRDRLHAVKRRSSYGLYRDFEPVLTADEIAEVEAQYGITLPEEYRSFLAEVGAGSPLSNALTRTEGKWVWECDGQWELDPSGPFLEDDQCAAEMVRQMRAAGHEPAVRETDEEYYSDYLETFGAEIGAEQWFLHRLRGAAYICEEGCAASSWLILVGPHRGELRFRDAGDIPPLEPFETSEGVRHNFYTWHMEWLEKQEAYVGIHHRPS